ncbi:MAG: hypothetical protein GEV28_16930 [Actinophytocola sp.]|uniref:hypothetical protein n=1 Tax=Actinophytocola sp. TaxID=1872138 RepID=UPI00132434D9|nr:hypothetical protein [Actinophytocola sp.]MPZ81977.1 hypothetical protein [Actinophytocola sp.]
MTVRVVHVPGRTPYASKIRDENVHILNETTVDGREVPRDVTLSWLLDHRPWKWLDVIHIHHPDFESIPILQQALTEASRAAKHVVFTAHDTTPVFGDRESHDDRIRLLAEKRALFVCLTRGAAREVSERWSPRAVLVPHGYVAEPAEHGRAQVREPGPTRFLLYGSLRANRDIETVLHCWRFDRQLANTTIHLLLRAPSRASLDAEAVAWRAILDHAADPRLLVDVRPFPTDAEVNQAVREADCLLLPYRWASHSGQLEHAYDLGALPVAARTGFLPDQVVHHRDRVNEPVWFDWSDGSTYEYGARLLTAMRKAHHEIQDGWRPHDSVSFSRYRTEEHEDIMADYREIYDGH